MSREQGVFLFLANMWSRSNAVHPLEFGAIGTTRKSTGKAPRNPFLPEEAHRLRELFSQLHCERDTESVNLLRLSPLIQGLLGVKLEYL